MSRKASLKSYFMASLILPLAATCSRQEISPEISVDQKNGKFYLKVETSDNRNLLSFEFNCDEIRDEAARQAFLERVQSFVLLTLHGKAPSQTFRKITEKNFNLLTRDIAADICAHRYNRGEPDTSSP